MRHTLVVIDNFSRYMMTVALIDKTADKTAVGLRKVLDKVKSEFGNPDITSTLTDDGGERAPLTLYSNRETLPVGESNG